MFKELPDEDTQLEHLLFIDQWMTAQGFEHYEISNYAKPGKEARHNLHYWKGSSYLALGPSAHSYDAHAQRRWKNVSSLHKYAQNPTSIDWEEFLTPAQRELEKWMLALRLAEGFPKSWLDTPERAAKALFFNKKNLLKEHPSDPHKMCLTPRGFALSDQVIAAFA